VGTRCANHVTSLYPQKLALTSPTGGGRSVGTVRSRTKATEFSFSLVYVCPSVRMGRIFVKFCSGYFFLKFMDISQFLLKSDDHKVRFTHRPSYVCGPGSSVVIATGYGLDGPGIETRWGWDFPYLSRPALRPTQHPVQWVLGRSFPRVKSGRGVTLTPHPLLVPWSRKSRAISLPPPSLWAVRPVQSLSACTRMHFTFLHARYSAMSHK